MASRMDRYSKKELISTSSARSDRNKSLYKQIEDLDSYTNIAGIATIENKNSIDIEKVRELLKIKEDKKQEKQIIESKNQEEMEEVRNYDINDLLSKAKDTTEKQKYRSLSAKQQKKLNELTKKNKTKKRSDIDYEEVEDILKTMSKIDSNDENTDDVGLLDDLKSDTMVGDASSIKKIIDEEKELTREFDEMELDKSFYTSTFEFTQRDFEELKDINHKIKKDNKFIIALLIILILLVIVGVVFFVIK